MTEQTKNQLSNPSALFIAASILIALGAIPGMPTKIFMTMGILSAGLGFFLLQKNVEEAKDESSENRLRMTSQRNWIGTMLIRWIS